jgi:hypothetical protein
MTPPSQFRSWTGPLYFFYGVWAWDGVVGLFDLCLLMLGHETITQHCIEHPDLAVKLLIVAVPLHVAAMVGLALHLLVPVKQEPPDSNIMDK